jgi:ABC-2 type transport system permease protein
MKGAFTTLIKREFWESKALWIGPLAAAVLIVGGSMFGEFHFGVIGRQSPSPLTGMAGGTLIGIAVFLGVVACLTVFSYLTDCLFSERKDRSILFWKSLPVSDAQTVLSKLAVAMVVVPLGVLALSVLTHLVVVAIFLIRFDELPGFAAAWSSWVNALGRVAVAVVFAMLWYLPVAAYLMLASVIARRAPMMYAALPPVVAVLWERLMLEGTHVSDFINQRLLPLAASNQYLLNPRGNPWMAFRDSNLWIGLAVAAGMLYIVIRLRQFRDDT